MRKMPTLFVRDPDDRAHVLPEVTPGCEWVLAGEGVATRKYDGTCVLLDRVNRWWARREVKRGKQPPTGFVAVEQDGTTGKTVGWEPVGQSPFARFHAEALVGNSYLRPGTYELLGPKVNGNREGLARHTLQRHADAERYPAIDAPLGYDELAAVMATLPWEGIVWHHTDGRMAKLKVRDFIR